MRCRFLIKINERWDLIYFQTSFKVILINLILILTSKKRKWIRNKEKWRMLKWRKFPLFMRMLKIVLSFFLSSIILSSYNRMHDFKLSWFHWLLGWLSLKLKLIEQQMSIRHRTSSKWLLFFNSFKITIETFWESFFVFLLLHSANILTSALIFDKSYLYAIL